MKKTTVAIMQPYFLPYIGYWQLIHAVDTFVACDNIKYTKQGWINRNRFLQHGKIEIFSLPLKRDSDSLNIDQRYLADSFPADRQKLLRRFESAYRLAPNHTEGMDLLSTCLLCDETNLFNYLFHSIKQVCGYLDIKTELIVSSSLSMNHGLKAEERVMATCKVLEATDYLNLSGGKSLYDKQHFAEHGIRLHFQDMPHCTYPQFDYEFTPNLSIIDLIMFNDQATARRFLDPQSAHKQKDRAAA